MIDLSRLVEAPASSLPYVDPALPDRPLVLHAARPRAYHTGTPVLFVHHGVRRNGRDYRDYWLDLVDEAGVLVISVEFPEASFPEYLWYNFGPLRAGFLSPRARGAVLAGGSGTLRTGEIAPHLRFVKTGPESSRIELANAGQLTVNRGRVFTMSLESLLDLRRPAVHCTRRNRLA